MRTVLASTALWAATHAAAHEGHGQIDPHSHGGDLLALLAMAVAVALWLWQRSRR
jgi:MYXO-CTERM domain-containing protein